jgi:hypothetical protein
MKARCTGSTVAEHEVSSYHALLGKLEALGVGIEHARIAESEISSAFDAWEPTPGGEAFALSPLRGVSALLFQRRIDELLDVLRRQL